MVRRRGIDGAAHKRANRSTDLCLGRVIHHSDRQRSAHTRVIFRLAAAFGRGVHHVAAAGSQRDILGAPEQRCVAYRRHGVASLHAEGY